MESSDTIGVTSWLSTLPPRYETEPHFESPPSKARTLRTSTLNQSRKRKLIDPDGPEPTSKVLYWKRRLTHRALREIETNMAPGHPTPSKVRDWKYSQALKRVRSYYYSADGSYRLAGRDRIT